MLYESFTKLMNACIFFPCLQETDPADGDGLDCLLGRRRGSQDVAAHARVRHGTSGLHRQGSKLEAHPGIRHRNASRWIGMCLKVVYPTNTVELQFTVVPK